ncbi:aminotransferase class III-fold pyridoxal phosphate-dependent enzyme [Thiothrix unzii]|uniref:Aminotransferase class III-fold pyridoxal phosphate-dependent enzyme n=1 Tax=Thiothrix unzii TaxID=111769 RepID=A0A975FDM1_9GAMM|nr:aminotransferase class III-fold pyridoxal phosphate-dependent enzyme [Thiothrix unzii]QTR55380.1 aminotransferase class III-fold pyridoxal phosphate-dependent enzyme [Thiothrix unzii]
MSIQSSLMPIYERVKPINGAWYSSQNNKKILDLSGQTLNLSLGQPPHEVREAIITEISKNVFFSSRFGSKTSENLANILIDIAPDNICCINHKLTNGSDAVETAIKIGCEMVRSSSIIALPNAWHGETMATLSLSSKLRGKYLGGNLNVTFSNEATIESLIEKINIIKRPSVVVIDPIGFSSGLFGFDNSKNFLPILRKSCQELGHFLIFDEIQSFGGFLEGEFFIYDIFNVESDAIAIGKALGQGFAVSACLYGKDTPELLYNEAEFTHGAQPPACAAAIAGIEYLKKNKSIIKTSLLLWNKLIDILESEFDEASFKRIGFVCSITPKKQEKTHLIFELLLNNGLIVRKGNASKSLMLKAPVVFNEEMFLWSLNVFRKCLNDLKSIKIDITSNYREIFRKENLEKSYVEFFLNHFSGVNINSRSIQEQYEVMLELDKIGIPCPKVYIKDELYIYSYITGISLDEYEIKSPREARSILSQLIDHIMKAHRNDIIIGDRWPGNTIWDGVCVTMIDFDIGYVGRNLSLMAFEHLFALFHHAAIIPKEMDRLKILTPYLHELKDAHENNNLYGIFIEFKKFYNSPRKKSNFTSLPVQIYQDVLHEFSTVICK